MKTAASSFFALHCISTQRNAMHLTHGFEFKRRGAVFVRVVGKEKREI